ncbi:hypothetical protein E4U42_005923 [Claviceps africana]|uniref:Uncharacterized protein n=1 Tax=Claviceps africana TaxID=83212 RepID=A0A8K0J3M7_9HYPO|nr:hypothetical protein E4U42_005923 [Claviceps africana]
MSPLGETADPDAATAAAAVFMSRRDSCSSLSSAAAAAALRARPMTPTNVAEVQSKRVRRRSSSVNSLTHGVRGRRELTRTPSVGSMMERTFRSPSPARSPAPREHVPPVPVMPSVDQILANHPTNRQIKGSKKAALQTQPFRTASQKAKDGGAQPSWFGAATARDAKPRAADAAFIPPTYVSEPRPGSVSPSINFSYPRAGALSLSSSSVDEHTLVYDPNSRRMVPRIELVSRSEVPRDGSEKPRKKKKSTSLDRTGSHLSKGTVSGRTMTPVFDEGAATAQDGSLPLEPDSAIGPEPPFVPSLAANSVSKKKKKKNKQKMQQASLPPQPGAVFAGQQTMDTEPTFERRPALPAKKPSVVKEEPQLEESEAAATVPVVAVGNSGAVRPNTRNPENIVEKRVRQSRASSASPARSAHFGSSPNDHLIVKHEPPARSVSPRKSALKLAASARNVSPSDDSSEASGSRALGSHDNEEAALARKKSVRVSWDDTSTVVVGESAQPQRTASPMIPSPQTKKPWHSVVSKFGRKESVPLADDETMSPRPALPQFGSVREKKVREPEERVLVRPSDRTYTAAENGSPSAAVGQSTGAITGATVSQDVASRNAANISKYREPLAVSPPVGNKEDQSAGTESSDDDFDSDASTEPEDNTESAVVSLSNQIITAAGAILPKTVATPSVAHEVIPTISVSQPSPRTTGPSDASSPGFFANSEVSSTDKADGDNKSDQPGISAPVHTEEVVAVGVGMVETAEEEKEETEAAQFSEAPEEIDGDGFLSLDAVVDSPTTNEDLRRNAEGEEPETTKTKTVSLHESRQPVMGTAAEVTDMSVPDDWENAKAYWKSLSIEKRRQLEIEALSEAGDEASTVKSIEPDSEPLVTAPALINERSYPTQRGTRWSAKEDNSDEKDEKDDKNLDAALLSKRAPVVATQAKTTADAPKSKNRISMRQSMRADPPAPAASDTGPERPGGMRKSMRNGQATGKSTSRQRNAETPASRPASAIIPSATPRIAMRESLRTGRSNGDTLSPSSSSGQPASNHQQPPTKRLSKSHRHTISSDDLTSSASIRPTLRRRGSDDSESSFKRKRSSSLSNDPRHARTSMRSSLREPSSPLDPTKRFSLRSLSPASFKRHSYASMPSMTSSPIGGGSGLMRQSLRDGATSSSSRLKRGSVKKSPGLGLGRRSKSTASRFADSSDEEDGGPSLFRSRFADSSDDEEPAPLPMSSVSPRSLGNGNRLTPNTLSRRVASPEPSGGDDVLVQPKRGGALTKERPALQRNRSSRGTIEPLSPADTSRPTSRRGSFMSILRRKKGTSDKVSKEVGESAERRDTALERSPEELARLRSDSTHEDGPSWPLPEADGADAENGRPREREPSRPSTSGGIAITPKKSFFLRRRAASQGLVGLDRARVDVNEAVPPIPAELAQTGLEQQPQQVKKKKFGALRKMFGIHD